MNKCMIRPHNDSQVTVLLFYIHSYLHNATIKAASAATVTAMGHHGYLTYKSRLSS